MRRIYKNPLSNDVFASTRTAMEITFDPAKDAINVERHGLSLAEAYRLEMSEAVIKVDDRVDYGETRFRAFGRIDGEGHCLVFTIRKSTIRAISFRRAHDKEMRRYGR